MLLPEIGAYLQGTGRGTLATDLFLGPLPDKPDAAVAIAEYAGEAPEYTHSAGGTNVEHPRIQVMVRATTYDAARTKAWQIYNDLDVRNTTLTGTRYLGIWPLQSPFSMGIDANGRQRMAFNARIEKAPSAS